MNSFEGRPRRLGVTTLCLDTRDDLTEARRLCARLGYREVAPFSGAARADQESRSAAIR
jgi:hypothetical protein